jgi:hypothetical protein
MPFMQHVLNFGHVGGLFILCSAQIFHAIARAGIFALHHNGAHGLTGAAHLLRVRLGGGILATETLQGCLRDEN